MHSLFFFSLDIFCWVFLNTKQSALYFKISYIRIEPEKRYKSSHWKMCDYWRKTYHYETLIQDHYILFFTYLKVAIWLWRQSILLSILFILQNSNKISASKWYQKVRNILQTMYNWAFKNELNWTEYYTKSLFSNISSFSISHLVTQKGNFNLRIAIVYDIKPYSEQASAKTFF